ncbi:hypothetical protein ABRT01_12135 [Lentibacillus sp. L22]
MQPFDTDESTANMEIDPKMTAKSLSHAIAGSYKRDMFNGDTESRSHWVTYALGNVAVSVVGTKLWEQSPRQLAKIPHIGSASDLRGGY